MQRYAVWFGGSMLAATVSTLFVTSTCTKTCNTVVLHVGVYNNI